MNTSQKMMFTRQNLIQLIIPLIIEQMLSVLVGMADTVMVSSVGEAAVSGVSLVDTINVLYFTIFSALTTGGSVVASQYIGQGNKEKACEAANQLLLASLLASLVLMFISLCGHTVILRAAFGAIEADVMKNAQTYFFILSLSLPFMAVYNACASLFRSMGNSKVSMTTSLIMNMINVGGNALLLYVFHMGVAGVAVASLVSRMTAAVIMLILLKNPKHMIHVSKTFTLRFHGGMVKKILNIGIPNSLETSIFQIGKVLVLSLVTSFGTQSITANAVANSVATFQTLAGGAIGVGMVTVVGQCVGAGAFDQAKKYTKQLLMAAYGAMLFINLIAFFAAPFFAQMFYLTTQTANLAVKLMRFYSICCILIWPASFTLPNALRAAGDVKYPMVVAIFSMWMFRVGFGYILGKGARMEVFGVWVAMGIDWLFRAICFGRRFMGDKWQKYSVV